MKFSLFTLLFTLSNLYVYGQHTSPTLTPEAKCYGQCKKPIYYIDTVKNYYVYTGDSTKENVKLVEIILKDQPKKEIWVQKMNNKNCLSQNPNDCMVWCLETVPAVKESLITVLDTIQTRNFYVHSIAYKQKVDEQKWYKREVLCSEKLNKDMIKKIQKALKNLDYFDHKVNGKLDNRLIEAMEDFQNENNLYVGGITMEALDLLKIKLEK